MTSESCPTTSIICLRGHGSLFLVSLRRPLRRDQWVAARREQDTESKTDSFSMKLKVLRCHNSIHFCSNKSNWQAELKVKTEAYWICRGEQQQQLRQCRCWHRNLRSDIELMYERWAPSLISPVRTPREGRRSEWEARFSRFVESFLSFAVKFVCPPVRREKKKNCLVFISCPNNSLVPQKRAVFHFKACMGLLSVDVKPKLNLQPLTWETHRSELLLLASVRRDSH